ncbi:hypothetical protein PHLCEN_2v7982 [Hermanssonia centrifuga]|uniref:Uncharacterized protein n=1 Tax=Hermanssonia centrifuga TaxID=98765 RepID=A0A2R6NV26_9APHY|nr:hypothetical protein PHLCEN_2v7982 [Hermanssonia centrifuga]
MVPYSAPAEFGQFSSVNMPVRADSLRNPIRQHPRKILPSQLEVAAQFEREEEVRGSSQSGPVVPHPSRRQRTPVVMHDEESLYSNTGDLLSPGSAIYGSDILPVTPSKRRADLWAQPRPSPPHTQSSFILTPYESRRSTYRHSFASSSDRASNESARSHEPSASTSASILSPRTSGSRSFLSPQNSVMKTPWRSTTRFSFSSIRSAGKSREDILPTVRESGSASTSYNPSQAVAPNTHSRKSLNKAKHATFGSSSFRRSRSKSNPAVHMNMNPLVVPEPMPPRPAHVRTLPPVPVATDIAPTLPALQFYPATPDPSAETSRVAGDRERERYEWEE